MGGTSGFATHAVLSKHSVIQVDPSMPPQCAALLGCGVITGVGAVTNSAKVAFGSSVAIVGLGGVGLCGLLGAKACGASLILAIDLEERKLAKAKEFGATHTYLVQKNDSLSKTVENIRQMIGPFAGAVDYAIEMAGNGPALQIAYGITKPGGTTVTIGLPDPEVDLSIQQVSITAEERTLIGSYLGSGVAIRDLPRYVELYKKGALPLEKLISGTIQLSQINEGFDMLERGEVIRLMVNLKDEK
ncbi:Alcohol dehydrogenase 1 [Galdieria sulphuraria]|uniref:Alcohol dehydrogenase (Zinc-containing) n=1 Tax=Galdieria sulphuraria TaxID=130081 RepID=M2XTD2_GALSU|nr:alcohol dehydrogenase (zinc-containing) [Galdieria sulphuraria]EME26898.1 alcohol dehydrogenase (zinc-containing) [Galdieria sulphuraria]GJD10635.1 Alcohol dehydrogenase 1 [Galdieria sulphuraria]|eukprot:XP_005703418.1 alcohol dehydrogenase (zinc-containing) [Galdieria sulphuraria]